MLVPATLRLSGKPVGNHHSFAFSCTSFNKVEHPILCISAVLADLPKDHKHFTSQIW
jgi:hypothetical protein